MTMFSKIKRIAILLLGYGLPIVSLASPITTFHHCVAQAQCEQQSENTPEWLQCCKKCLASTHFKSQTRLRDLMHAHLDLVCTQFQGVTTPIEKPYLSNQTHLFMMGSYKYYSGKDGCNESDLMWSAPLTLHQTEDKRWVGGTDLKRGLVRIYPIASCPNTYLNAMVSVSDLDVVVQGIEDSKGDQLSLDFYPPVSNKGLAVDAANEHLINVMTGLAAKSYDPAGGSLHNFILMPTQKKLGTYLVFETAPAGVKQGWVGKTYLFVESGRPNVKPVIKPTDSKVPMVPVHT